MTRSYPGQRHLLSRQFVTINELKRIHQVLLTLVLRHMVNCPDTKPCRVVAADYR